MYEFVRVPGLVRSSLGTGREATETEVKEGSTFRTLDIRESKFVATYSTFTHSYRLELLYY